MKQTAIKIKNYTINNVNIVDNNNLQKKVLNFLLISFGVFAVFYAIILGNIVFNIVERQNLASQSKIISNEVGNLELEYLAASNKIDLALSQEMGFKEVKTNFAVRKSISALELAKNEL